MRGFFVYSLKKEKHIYFKRKLNHWCCQINKKIPDIFIWVKKPVQSNYIKYDAYKNRNVAYCLNKFSKF